VRIYEYSSGSWSQLGGDIDGEADNDRSGYSVSLNSDGDRVAIGARYNDGNGTSAGHVRIYEYSSDSWSQLGSDIDGEATGDESGWSISLNSDGDRVAIGAYGNDGTATSAGHVRIYEYSNSSWSQLGSDIDGEAAADESGNSVSMNSDGDRVAIGARLNDGTGSNAGHVRIYYIFPPKISSVSLASDNSTLAVTFSEAVYTTTDAATALVVGDFAFSISGGTATLSSATPSSISISGNVYTLGISFSVTPDGSETLTVNPASATAIYDAGSNAAAASQSNNTATLNDKTVPTISSVSLASDNSTIAVTFSEAVYTTTDASSSLVVGDFVFSISGGTATLSSATPSSISISGNVYTLGISFSVTPDGSETLTVNPASATAIYDAGNNGAAASQSNNTATLNDQTAPTVTFSPTDGATDVTLANNITLTFSEAVRNTDDSALTDTNVDALITLKETDASGSDIAFDATIDSDKKVITVDPSSDLSYSQVVYVAVGATVEDGVNNAVSASSATFTAVANNAPVATAQTVTATEDTEVTITLAGTDAEGSALTYSISTLPTNGVLYQTSDGTTKGDAFTTVPTAVTNSEFKVIYLPPSNGNGDGHGNFGFKVNDGTETSAEATVTVNVTAVNDAPVLAANRQHEYQ
jgi:hypothetical protein